MGYFKNSLGDVSIEEFERMCRVVLNSPRERDEMNDIQIDVFDELYHIWLTVGGKKIANELLEEFGGSLYVHQLDEYEQKLRNHFINWVKSVKQ